jgi:hypothetical protein
MPIVVFVPETIIAKRTAWQQRNEQPLFSMRCQGSVYPSPDIPTQDEETWWWMEDEDNDLLIVCL